ncbi:MAG: hypothetical protein IPL53_15595 [Ignavibacteria bacterium]|nr:hypothetical protein [Ignavibacteria bacterium]
MKNLIYDLGKCADLFIELQNYESDEKIRGLSVMKEQMIRNLNTAFERSMKGYKIMLSELKQDYEYFYYNYRALKLEREFTADINKANAEKIIDEEKEIEYLTLFYLNECSDVFNTLLINNSYLDKDYKSNNLKLFLNFIERFDHSYHEITDCSLLSLKIILDKTDHGIFAQLKNIFTGNSHKFSSTFNSYMGLTLMEYCNRNIMNGKTEYIKEMFEISFYIFENDLLINDKKGYMNPFVFTQIVSTASSLNKFDWVKEFINENMKKINPEYRDKFYNFACLTLNFKMKDFSKAMDHVSKMEVSSQMDHVSIKRYQLMIYYESGYSDELYSMIETFRNFISKNKKLAESVKLQAGKFVFLIKKFSDIKFNAGGSDKIKLSELKDELLRTEVINKIWLLEKAEELFN